MRVSNPSSLLYYLWSDDPYQLFSMLEGDVCAAEIIDLQPATEIIGYPFDAVHRFLANLLFCMGALEFTFDLLHRAVQWWILGAGRKLVTYATPFGPLSE